MADAVVMLRNIWKSYKEGDSIITVLRDVSAVFYRGEIVGIHGPSGSGKSTLLRIIAGLERPDRGDIIVDGYDLSMLDDLGLAMLRNTVIAYIPQDYGLVDNLTVRENVEIPMMIAGVPKHTREKKAFEVLKYVGLREKASCLVSKLSGGEKQRVAIARALTMTPTVLLADEPTANLDKENALRIINMFNKVRSDFNTTVIVVTHDPRIIGFFERTFLLDDGSLKVLNSSKYYVFR